MTDDHKDEAILPSTQVTLQKAAEAIIQESSQKTTQAQEQSKADVKETTKEELKEREIPIYSELPPAVLNKQMTEDLTWIAFREDSVAKPGDKLDTIFTMGAPQEIERQANAALQAIDDHHPQQLVLSGGMPWQLPHLANEPNLGEPQSVALYREMIAQAGADIPKDVKISIETESTNTKENAEYLWKALPRDPDFTLGVLSKNFHAGRSLDTVGQVAAKHNWHGHIVALPYGSGLPGHAPVVEMDPATWQHHKISRGRVFGEFQRVSTYGPRGDIYYGHEHQQRVGRISDTLANYKSDHRNGRTVMVPGAALKNS